MSSSIWATLSAIDCNQHTEKKGQFSYLSWTWAWAMVKERYPDANWQLEDDVFFPDGSMEVRVTVTIEGHSSTMWLPVLNFQNKAIQNPNAFDINSGRMRCLTKCLAVGFGLGHYIYAGESVPQAQGLSDEEFGLFVEFLANKDGLGLLKYMAELGEDKCAEAYNRAPKGQKVAFKDNVKAVQQAGQDTIDHYVVDLRDGAENDPTKVHELIAEINEDGAWLKGVVWARLSDITKHQIKQILEEAA